MCKRLIYLASVIVLLGGGLYGSPQPDTILYDDGNPLNIDINQDALFAVRFTPVQPFNLMCIYLMFRNDYNTTDGANVWIAENEGGIPAWPATFVGQVPPPLTNETWIQFDLAGPIYFENDFFVIVQQKGGYSPGPGFWIGLDYGTTTYRTVKSYNNGQGWLDEPTGDALIRAGGVYGTAERLVFSQMDFNLDGTNYTDTEWGSVDFTFTGQEPIMYFNLAVNGSWQVQNIPVLSIEGEDVTQSISFAFDLGVPSGTVVASLDYGYTFTDITIDSMPAETGTAVVSDLEVIINSGAKGEEIPPLEPAEPLVGGAVVANAKKHAHADFPNQECGEDECTPAAVSNSLKFLNKKHNLGLDDNDLSIAKMKEATNWGNPVIDGKPVGRGTWIDHDNTRPEGERNAWWEDKKKYMEDNKYPITTKQIKDLNEVSAQIDAGQDVELQGDWHTAAIVGITDLGGGKFSIDVAHDTKQGKAGGTESQTITYDPNTKKFTGSPGFFDGSSFRYAVIECPNCVAVDDFESYNDSKNIIYETWKDGVMNNTSSLVFLGTAVYDPVHGGEQSMGYMYKNSFNWGAGYYSEATADTNDLEIGSDWTKAGVKALSLWFYGDPNNDAEPMYVALEDTNGTTALVHHEDPNAVRIEAWTEWNIDLNDFTDVNLADVNNVTIGIGERGSTTAGGNGTMFFDDIGLCQPRCIPGYGPLADFTNDCVVDYEDLKIMGYEWLNSDFLIEPDLNWDGIVNFEDFVYLADMWVFESAFPECCDKEIECCAVLKWRENANNVWRDYGSFPKEECWNFSEGKDRPVEKIEVVKDNKQRDALVITFKKGSQLLARCVYGTPCEGDVRCKSEVKFDTSWPGEATAEICCECDYLMILQRLSKYRQ